jgi:hypothetical protein
MIGMPPAISGVGSRHHSDGFRVLRAQARSDPGAPIGGANEKGTQSALSARDQTGLMKPISSSITAFGPIGVPILWWFAE